ncbi:hypothetical protein [Luethyella okanaganae]|uniref:Uncharacterized protein n=1 Tax=Luethyella okanaganae TaxID=69372 RepID=A0ABW1VAH4_9MICO
METTSTDLLMRAVFAATKDEFDPNTVTPGVWGFVITFTIAAVVVLLVMDMVRRVRRTNYKAEIHEKLQAELAARAELAAKNEAERGTSAASGGGVEKR